MSSLNPLLIIIRFYAKSIAWFGGAVARSCFNDLAYRRTDTSQLIVAGDRPDQVELGIGALNFLKIHHHHAYKVTATWLRRVGFLNSTRFRTHFCDGTVLIKATESVPESVVAALLYRLALEVMFVKRFKMPEALLLCSRCRFFGLKRQLHLLIRFKCPKEHVKRHE